jgi:hypothetical protein
METLTKIKLNASRCKHEKINSDNSNDTITYGLKIKFNGKYTLKEIVNFLQEQYYNEDGASGFFKIMLKDPKTQNYKYVTSHKDFVSENYFSEYTDEYSIESFLFTVNVADSDWSFIEEYDALDEEISMLSNYREIDSVEQINIIY